MIWSNINEHAIEGQICTSVFFGERKSFPFQIIYVYDQKPNPLGPVIFNNKAALIH